jgi:hypothetical protein
VIEELITLKSGRSLILFWIFDEKLLKSYVGLAATIMSIISDPKLKLRRIICSRSVTFETLATDEII